MAAIAAGVGVMVMCSSSLAAAMMMGGSEDDAAATTTTTTPKTPVVPTRPKYVEYPDHDFTGGDIACTAGEDESDACEAKCDANDKCVSYIHTAEDKICCLKHGTPNYTSMPDRKITAYIKNIDGYEVKEVGDRPAGDIEHMNPGTLPTCKTKCDSLDNCIGFNFKDNSCFIKKAEGISATYSVNGYQFYHKM
jgi:hypothetical protein